MVVSKTLSKHLGSPKWKQEECSLFKHLADRVGDGSVGQELCHPEGAPSRAAALINRKESVEVALVLNKDAS